jgi:hypothetical protein
MTSWTLTGQQEPKRPVSNPLAKMVRAPPGSLVFKGISSAGEGSRTPMSFRTDGFEPSAYTIPPPRPGAS